MVGRVITIRLVPHFPSHPIPFGLSFHPVGYISHLPMESDRMCFSRLALVSVPYPLTPDHHALYLNLNLWGRLLPPDTTEVMRYENN